MNAPLLTSTSSSRGALDRGQWGERDKRSAHRLIAPVDRHSPNAWWVYESDFKRRVALEALMRHMFMRR